MKIKHNSINYSVNTVDDLLALSGMNEDDVTVVTDENRGGTFVYRNSNIGINNDGTIFNGWTRQYDGAVNVKWFGAKGDSLGKISGENDDTEAFEKALTTNKDVYAPKGVYAISRTLHLNSGQTLYGDGIDKWYFTFDTTNKSEENGTSLRFIGTGTKDFTVDQVSNVYQGGGVKNGYSLLDLTNSDADGTTPATSKQLSVAIKLNGNSVLRNLRVYNSNQGIKGYKDENNTSMGDDWNFGVVISNVVDTLLDNVQIVGYWRTSAVILLESDKRDSYGICERNVIENSTLQGNVGLAIRACDTRQVLSTTSDTVTIGYDTGHQYLSSGTFRIVGGDTVSYSGITYDSTGDGTLTLTGLSQDVTGSGQIRAGNSSYGFSGTNINNTNIWSLTHSSRQSADTIQGADSSITKCLEISGYPMRGIRFNASRLMNGFDFVNTYFNEAYDIVFGICQFENGQLIASPFKDNSSAVYPSGDTRNLTLIGTDCSASRYPYIITDADNGFNYFEPRSIVNTRDNVSSEPTKGTQIFSPEGQRLKLVGVKNGAGGIDITDYGTVIINDGHLVLQNGGIVDIENTNAVIKSSSGDILTFFNSSRNATFNAGLTVLSDFITGSLVRPSSDGLQDLGRATNFWRDAYIKDSIKMKSPDGTVWSITVDDNGNVTAS